MTKTVAIVGTRGYPSYYGGFETAVRKLVPHLADSGWDVTVYGRPGAVREDDPTRDPRITSVLTRGLESKSLSTLSYGLTACLHAARRRPKVALVMNVANGYFLPLLRARGVRTVVNVDGIEWDRAKWGRLAKLVFRVGARMTARWADELVFDARAIAERWERDFGRTGTFIPYGGEVRADLPLEPGLTAGEYVLVVARFVPENSIPEFFEAVERLAARTTIVIVGSSGYGGELDERAAELAERFETVRSLGHVSDDRRLLGLWQHCGVYFHGHSVGGTNPTLVQAMTLGCAVVARDTVYNREVLGSGGVFCAPEPGSIAAEILRVLGDSEGRIELQRLNRARAEQHYSWRLVNTAYEQLLARD